MASVLSIFTSNELRKEWQSARRKLKASKIPFIHAVGFESGLIVVTLLFTAWFLSISFVEALAPKARLLIFFFSTIALNLQHDSHQPY
ncbi:hypothetical protein CS022_02120 [Veronia nyctiphanis]|uniref:Chlorhexidine efflux transporter domain-containing protein n=1 Tax=Veronia nyctiphanis TaxID=1278244 RepID=A0A4Q0YT87_9GAMM|nr:chlorhexidine efflux transporter [Veronia nyctiphanis]RXJ74426.1 hypothetical protein CS022_02120 [Veronia nyctiphanis]